VDIADFSKKMEDAQRKVEKVAGGFEKAGKIMTMGITAPILAAGAAAFKMASDFDESLNKVDVAFGYASAGVRDWSETTLKSFGLAQGTALDMAATFGDMGTSMGLSKSAAAEMSKEMVGLAGDMASFKNMNMSEVHTALTAVYTGETESLKRMGIVMTQVNLEAFAMSQGITKNIADMTQAEQVQLRYNYVLENTKNAQGDFIRTGGGAANQMRILQESVKELSASMGQNLIPVLTPIIVQFNKWLQQFGELNPEAQKTVLVIAGLAAAVGPTLMMISGGIKTITAIQTAMTAWKAATVAATAAQTGLNVAMLANPVGLVVAAIAALIAITATLIVVMNKAANEEKAMYDQMISDNKKAQESARAEIEKTYGVLQAAVDEKIAAENTYHTETMALNQKAYEEELANGQKLLDAKKKDLSERQKLLDDNYNASIDAIRAEYGVYETTQKSMVDLAKEAAQGKIDALNKSFDVAKANTQLQKEQIASAYEAEVKSARDAHDEKSSLLDAEYEKKLAVIDLGLSEEVKALQEQIRNIDEKTKAEDKAVKGSLTMKKVALLEGKIATETDAAERASLQEELQSILAKVERERILETRENEKAAIEERITQAKKLAEEKKEAAKQELESAQTALDGALETELTNLAAAKEARLIAEDEKLAALEERIKAEIVAIGTALDLELTAINNVRLEKEAAETAKYTAAKKSLDDEAAYLDSWIDTVYKPAMDEKLRIANENEDARHSKIMENLAAESAALQTKKSDLTAISDAAFKMEDLRIRIQKKQAELDRGSNRAFGPVANSAALQAEIDAMKAELHALIKASVNSYAVGTPYVPHDQLAYVHQGEEIVPAAENRRNKTASSSGSSGGTTIILNVDISKIQDVDDLIRIAKGAKQSVRMGVV